MKKIAMKFGARGAHVIVPVEWLGKEIECHIAENKDVTSVSNTPTKAVLYDKLKECHIAKESEPIIDESEAAFLEQYASASDLMKGVLYSRAVKQFGKDRVDSLIQR